MYLWYWCGTGANNFTVGTTYSGDNNTHLGYVCVTAALKRKAFPSLQSVPVLKLVFELSRGPDEALGGNIGWIKLKHGTVERAEQSMNVCGGWDWVYMCVCVGGGGESDRSIGLHSGFRTSVNTRQAATLNPFKVLTQSSHTLTIHSKSYSFTNLLLN